MSNHREKAAIHELIPSISAECFRVFIAKSETHGFYTDNEGTRVISFQYDLGGISFSGNYITNSPSNGSGWQITDGAAKLTTFKKLFNVYPPACVVRDSKWRYTTLAEQLEKYNKSSQYTEVDHTGACISTDCLKQHGEAK